MVTPAPGERTTPLTPTTPAGIPEAQALASAAPQPPPAVQAFAGRSSSLAIHGVTKGEPPLPLRTAELAKTPDVTLPVPDTAAPPGDVSPSSSAATAKAATLDSLLGEEARLVRDANDAAKAGDTAHALALLDEHAARFPAGALEPERSAERIFILCAAGRADEALVAKDAFLRSHGSGPLAARVRASCSPSGR